MRTTRAGLWRHRDFLSLWGAETISQFGTQVSLLALPLVAIIVLEESAFKIAALTSVEFLPFLLFTLPGRRLGRSSAAEADPRARQRRPGGRAPVGADRRTGSARLTIWQLYVVGFTVGVCTVFFDVAYQSYIPALVGREDVVEANSKLEISRAAANIAGPGMAGGLIALLDRPGRRARRRGQLRASPPLLLLRDPQAGGGAAARRAPVAPSRARSRASATSSANPYQRTMVAMTAHLQLLRPGRLLDPARLRRPRARPVARARSGSRSRSATSARWPRRSPPSGSATGSASGGRSCSPRACSGRARC